MSKYEFNGKTTLSKGFDPSQQEGSFEPLPPGAYPVEIIEASINEAKNGSGERLNLTCKVIEGDYENRHVFDGITLSHETSAQAVDIGKRRLKDLCIATGITEVVTDIEVFKFKPFMAKIVIRKDPDGVYSDSNKITRVMPMPDIIPPAPAVPTPVKPNGKRNGTAGKAVQQY